MSISTALPSSRLLPKIVHPASQLSREDHGKMSVEARKLASATGVRGRPRSCPEMSVKHLLNSSRSRLTSSQLRHRTCSARQQRGGHGGQSAAGHRIPQFSTTEEVDLLIFSGIIIMAWSIQKQCTKFYITA